MPNLKEQTVEDRLRLVRGPWDSIAAQAGNVPIDPEHITEIRERLAAYRSDSIKGERARDMKEAIRRTL